MAGNGNAMVQTWALAGGSAAVVVEPLPAATSAASATPDRHPRETSDRHPRESGNPAEAATSVDPRVRGDDGVVVRGDDDVTATVGAPAVPAFAPTDSGTGSLGGALVALLLVVGLILGLAWLAKRVPGMGAAAGNRNLKLVGSLSIGPRERVVVVDVGGTQLLLSTGAGGTRTLHTLEQPLPEPEAGTASPFAQVLAQHFGKNKA